jgi:hypothetical protein
MEPLETQVRLGLARGGPAFIIKRADNVHQGARRQHCRQARGEPAVDRRRPSFFFGVVQPALVAPLTAALEPLAKEKGFRIIAKKQPKPTGGGPRSLMSSAPIDLSHKYPPSSL